MTRSNVNKTGRIMAVVLCWRREVMNSRAGVSDIQTQEGRGERDRDTEREREEFKLEDGGVVEGSAAGAERSGAASKAGSRVCCLFA
jgi:hypothetical protein